jgi:hypothetical protein
MSQTTCVTCGQTVDTDADVHYRRVEPTASGPTVLTFCSAACAAENAGLFEE